MIKPYKEEFIDADFQYFDEKDCQNKEYSRDDLIDIIRFVFELKITSREREVLELKIIAPHLTYQQIADKMDITKQAVDKFIRKIVKKYPPLEKIVRNKIATKNYLFTKKEVE